MYISRYNLVFRIDDDTILFNPLSGNIDILDKFERDALENIMAGRTVEDSKLMSALLDRGYLYNKKEDEERAFEEEHKRFLSSIERSPEPYFIVPTYDCNMRCTYCFQRDLSRREEVVSEDVLEKMFETIALLHERRKTAPKPIISLFGGEPLMHKNYGIIKRILLWCSDYGATPEITTNGLDLEFFCGLLTEANASIQVSLDGPKEIHDERRRQPNGEGSFDKIVLGVDKALDAGIKTKLRIGIDRGNVFFLPKMADFIIKKNWLSYPNFHTYVAPIQDFACRGNPQCVTEEWFFDKVFENYEKFENTEIFAFPGFTYGIARLVKGGSISPPTFKACWATIYEHCLDLYGDIYPCLETCGNKNLSVGKFFPKLEMKEELVSKWRNRSILSIPQCKKCPVSLLCGGGCAILALNKYGNLSKPFCRPIRKSLELALSHYLPKLKKLEEME